MANDGQQQVYKEKSMKEKLKSVFSFSTKHKQDEYATGQYVSTMQEYQRMPQVQESWSSVPNNDPDNDLKTGKAIEERRSFAQKEREEQALQEEEKILLEREEQSCQKLEVLLHMTENPALDNSWFEIIREEMNAALKSFRRIHRFSFGRTSHINDLREKFQSQLEKIYQIGKRFAEVNEITDEQADLVRKIMYAADDVQLPSSRILLIRKERQFRNEDDKGYRYAKREHELKHFDQQSIEAVGEYTSPKFIHGTTARFQFMNRLLRGQITEADIPEENETRTKVLTTIERLKTVFSKGQKKTKKLYRGMNLWDVYEDRILHPESLVGSSFIDKGYLSTSRKREASIKFLTVYGGIKYAAMDRFIQERLNNPNAQPPERLITGHSLFEIVARQGAHSLDIMDKSEAEDEEEVLFEPGTRIYLKSVRLADYPIAVSQEEFIQYVSSAYGNQAQQILNATLFDGWEKIYINVSIPIFQGEIR